ncbi:GNAT family N-acetyltransferase [Desulfopila aestuarii]|uniref:Acetyltransferase (GNAT) family protein n=1 Tax=Desulfopila aestuarii DSM 18488 TaxID=1121416 RepID=A0A1M7XY50_9BACT|nr:GNAT family N-acetyltransferase [Desulfopila aestuarii]SHO43941.1 Acetyltransferase (GNAT) family protein [Desulfopila aestuarii DSM 18488]
MFFNTRNVNLGDHQKIIDVMPNWWGGRDLTSGLSKIYFIHFQNSSFVTLNDGNIIGFLIGFMSQSIKNQAYIQLAGVDPNFRKQGVAKMLYNEFYEICKKSSISTVTSCTSPVNELSIKFHQSMGFEILKGDCIENGYEITSNYLGEGNHKVLFKKDI